MFMVKKNLKTSKNLIAIISLLNLLLPFLENSSLLLQKKINIHPVNIFDEKTSFIKKNNVTNNKNNAKLMIHETTTN